MHKEIEKIKKLEGPIKIVKNLFSKNEINKFLITLGDPSNFLIFSISLCIVYSPMFIKVPRSLAPL